MSLRQRVYLANAVLLGITVMGTIAMIWYTYKTEDLFTGIVARHIPVYQAAEALETSLLNQKGYLSYYLLDKNPEWLRQLADFKLDFESQLACAKPLVTEDWEKEALARIESVYTTYIKAKDRVMALYEKGDPGTGAALHREVRANFFRIFELCEKFKTAHKKAIDHAVEDSRTDARHLRYISLLAIVTVVLLSLLINYIFTRHILGPIRKLAAEADQMGDGRVSGNEMAALKSSVHGLIENAEQTHAELVRNRETLMQSEKLALVGRLAAGMAHSIRNPMTSIKMRLFSLGRSGKLSGDQKENISVISTEIGQINKILENFLEFSRPPKLTMEKQSPSQVVDNTLRLLEQRLKSYGVTVHLIRSAPLDEVLLDAGQLKEAMANIIINACEAMKKGGRITITETMDSINTDRDTAVIRIQDSGPGIPASIQNEVFNPFFTTKDDGTGLGLSICFNIISEHGGCLVLDSQEDQGTCFTITLPAGEDAHGKNFDH
ncbi:sensor histidine kinase [Desulfobacter vibrioformis]|uniref:sensor histidine kinase n=1 Tax=Desulfobacter vibrioformis TaxID=34031 RepID=UPI00054D009C|nr:ATP-binding protein [Desulfobacter vibrioformis]